VKQGTQLDTLAGRYALAALREASPSIQVIEDLESTYGLTPRDAESLVEFAEEWLAIETGVQE
jgi:hypothetical protein